MGIRVLIGIPAYGNICNETTMSLLMLKSRGIVVIQEGSRISSNRNMLVKYAKQYGCSHILFIDSDMQFPADALERLLTYDKDIVCATTCRRDDETGVAIGKSVYEATGNLVEMELVGCCFMLIKMSVFDKIGLPSFWEPPNGETGDTDGEDHTFCQRVRSNGFLIWLDQSLSAELGHVGKKIYRIKAPA